MLKNHSLKLLATIAFLGSLVGVQYANAHSIYNNTSTTLNVRVIEGGMFDHDIAPGDSVSCPWDDFNCNFTLMQTGILTVQIETLDGDERDLSLVVQLEAGGWVSINEWDGPFGEKQVHAIGVATDGTHIDQSPRGFSFVSSGVSQPHIPRHVRFLASADCQYCAPTSRRCNTSAHDEERENATLTNQHMVNRVAADSSLRGILYAGDLTHNGNVDEMDDWYIASVAGFRRVLYEGAGNHDVVADHIPDMIHEAKHTTVKAKKADYMHYSWDWQDVHFVQLNLMPANDEAPGRDEDPYDALSFLSADLVLNATTGVPLFTPTQRPVVLIYHYGHDYFGYQGEFPNSQPQDHGPPWWTESQRLAAWNAMAPYNIILIINGHSHLSPSSTSSGTDGQDGYRFLEWLRPAGASGGPAKIQTVIAGAAFLESYIEVEINSTNQIKIDVLDANTSNPSGGQIVKATKYYNFNTPVWIDHDATETGYGWFQRPFATLNAALNSFNPPFAHPNAPDPNVTFDFASGSYNESGTYNPAFPITLNPTDGPITIGN